MCTVAGASLNQHRLVVSISEFSMVEVVGFEFCGFWVSKSFFGVYKLWIAGGSWGGGLGRGMRGFHGHGFGGRGLWDVCVWVVGFMGCGSVGFCL